MKNNESWPEYVGRQVLEFNFRQGMKEFEREQKPVEEECGRIRRAWLAEKFAHAKIAPSKLKRPSFRAIKTYESGKTTRRTLHVRKGLAAVFKCPLRDVPL